MPDRVELTNRQPGSVQCLEALSSPGQRIIAGRVGRLRFGLANQSIALSEERSVHDRPRCRRGVANGGQGLLPARRMGRPVPVDDHVPLHQLRVGGRPAPRAGSCARRPPPPERPPPVGPPGRRSLALTQPQLSPSRHEESKPLCFASRLFPVRGRKSSGSNGKGSVAESPAQRPIPALRRTLGTSLLPTCQGGGCGFENRRPLKVKAQVRRPCRPGRET